MFARNVMFIPNQNATSSGGTDWNCDKDPMGCWVPSFGVVDTEWTNKTFPANIPYDHAYYVVNDTGHHQGMGSTEALDQAAGSLGIQFTPLNPTAFTHALGCSYSQDASLRYCAQNLAAEGSYHDWWLGACELSGGASGGPWVQPMDTQQVSGPIVSVNSWGYTTQPGMAGPKLSDNSSICRFADAKTGNLSDLGSKADGQQGVIGTGTSCTP